MLGLRGLWYGGVKGPWGFIMESQNPEGTDRLWCIKNERDESKLTERLGKRACR